MATKNASTFDGTNDYFARGAGLTGCFDSKKWTVSFWYKHASGATSVSRTIGGGNQYRWGIYTTNLNQMRIYATDSAQTSILSLYGNQLTPDTNWHHAMMSADLAIATIHLYIDGVNVKAYNSLVDAEIDFTLTNHWFGAGAYASNPWYGDISEFWMAIGVYVDLSLASERRRFFGGNKAPIVTAVGLANPIVYIPNGAASTNAGTGGNYTATGAVDASTGPEVIYNMQVLQNSYRQRRF